MVKIVIQKLKTKDIKSIKENDQKKFEDKNV